MFPFHSPSVLMAHRFIVGEIMRCEHKRNPVKLYAVHSGFPAVGEGATAVVFNASLCRAGLEPVRKGK